MSKSLYEIQDELQQIIDNIEENGGEVDEFTEEALKIKQEEFESKIESYCNAITMLKSEAECCKNEKQRIVMCIIMILIGLLAPIVLYLLSGFRMGIYSFLELRRILYFS